MEYLKGKHIPLFVATLAVLVFLSFPYVLVLTFIPCLQKIETQPFKILCWVPRLKPFFDAYTGPYKDRYRFWTGFLLVVRTALLLVFAFNYTNEPSLNTMATATALQKLMGYFNQSMVSSVAASLSCLQVQSIYRVCICHQRHIGFVLWTIVL